MNIKKLEDAVENMKSSMGTSLLGTEIWAEADGQSLVSYNPNPKAVALFNRLTGIIKKTLKDASFPSLRDYYMLNLDDGLVFVMAFEGYGWGMLIDPEKTQLGLLLNVIVPDAQSALSEAVK